MNPAICPVCEHDETSVVRSEQQRRRRECKLCGHRWTTVEVTLEELNNLLDVKRKVDSLVGVMQLTT